MSEPGREVSRASSWASLVPAGAVLALAALCQFDAFGATPLAPYLSYRTSFIAVTVAATLWLLTVSPALLMSGPPAAVRRVRRRRRRGWALALPALLAAWHGSWSGWAALGGGLLWLAVCGLWGEALAALYARWGAAGRARRVAWLAAAAPAGMLGWCALSALAGYLALDLWRQPQPWLWRANPLVRAADCASDPAPTPEATRASDSPPAADLPVARSLLPRPPPAGLPAPYRWALAEGAEASPGLLAVGPDGIRLRWHPDHAGWLPAHPGIIVSSPAGPLPRLEWASAALAEDPAAGVIAPRADAALPVRGALGLAAAPWLDPADLPAWPFALRGFDVLGWDAAWSPAPDSAALIGAQQALWAGTELVLVGDEARTRGAAALFAAGEEPRWYEEAPGLASAIAGRGRLWRWDPAAVTDEARAARLADWREYARLRRAEPTLPQLLRLYPPAGRVRLPAGWVALDVALAGVLTLALFALMRRGARVRRRLSAFRRCARGVRGVLVLAGLLLLQAPRYQTLPEWLPDSRVEERTFFQAHRAFDQQQVEVRTSCASERQIVERYLRAQPLGRAESLVVPVIEGTAADPLLLDDVGRVERPRGVRGPTEIVADLRSSRALCWWRELAATDAPGSLAARWIDGERLELHCRFPAVSAPRRPLLYARGELFALPELAPGEVVTLVVPARGLPWERAVQQAGRESDGFDYGHVLRLWRQVHVPRTQSCLLGWLPSGPVDRARARLYVAPFEPRP